MVNGPYSQSRHRSQARSSNQTKTVYSKCKVLEVCSGPAPIHIQPSADAYSTEGELIDLIEDFNDGRIQFAFLRVKDTNSKLPKNVLIGWVRRLGKIKKMDMTDERPIVRRRRARADKGLLPSPYGGCLEYLACVFRYTD